MSVGPPEWLGLFSGLFVGLSLGLTGGGGSIFAVPLLIYGMAVDARVAIGLSLAVVGLTAGFGAAMRLRAREVELRAGFVFAVAGMLFAPIGTSVGRIIALSTLLIIFAVLMAFVGWRMWMGKPGAAIEPGPCVANGRGKLGPGCYVRLSAGGAVSGLLSGLLGIGGGFIVVPVLIYVTGMSIHRAVATSLMVIFLISVSGVAATILHGQEFPMPLSLVFLAGGMAGMLFGSGWRSRLSGESLQRIFAVGMWFVAVYMLVRNV